MRGIEASIMQQMARVVLNDVGISHTPEHLARAVDLLTFYPAPQATQMLREECAFMTTRRPSHA